MPHGQRGTPSQGTTLPLRTAASVVEAQPLEDGLWCVSMDLPVYSPLTMCLDGREARAAAAPATPLPAITATPLLPASEPTAPPPLSSAAPPPAAPSARHLPAPPAPAEARAPEKRQRKRERQRRRVAADVAPARSRPTPTIRAPVRRQTVVLGLPPPPLRVPETPRLDPAVPNPIKAEPFQLKDLPRLDEVIADRVRARWERTVQQTKREQSELRRRCRPGQFQATLHAAQRRLKREVTDSVVLAQGRGVRFCVGGGRSADDDSRLITLDEQRLPECTLPHARSNNTVSPSEWSDKHLKAHLNGRRCVYQVE